jgi:hypothetical protein
MYRTAISTDDFVITAPQLSRGETVIIENVAMSNLDTSQVSVAVGFKHETDDVWLESVTLGDSGTYSRFKGPVTLRSDDRLMVKVFSPTEGDRMVVNVTGYWQCVITGV